MHRVSNLVALAAGIAAILAGCGGWKEKGQTIVAAKATNQAAFLTGCPTTDISVATLDDVTLAVTACDQRLIYKLIGACRAGPMTYSPGQVEKHCQVVLNSETVQGDASGK